MLRTAEAHYRTQRKLIALAIAAMRRAFGQGDARRAVPMLTRIQRDAARDAARSVRAMLAEQRFQSEPVGAVNPSALSGVASDGRSLLRLVVEADDELYQLERVAVTQVKDAARAAAGIEVTVRPRLGFVRMVVPPSCSRCVILAGKWYAWNEGFLRHPGCKCVHVPANEDAPHDLTTNPHDYFESLTRAEQDKVFTKAGAEAIRNGADIFRIVNARRSGAGLSRPGRFTKAEQRVLRDGRDRGRLAKVDVYGTPLEITQDGVTRRARNPGNVDYSKTPRLMPEAIYELAKGDRDEAIRLLRRFGYLL